MLIFAAAAALALQTAQAQNGSKPAAGASAKLGSSDADVAKTEKAAADALGLSRWSNVGGGRLPEVDVINTIEFWASGTPSDYHVSLGYNPPGMRVESGSGSGQHTFQVVSGKYAWDESEMGGGLVPGKGTATPMPAVAKQRSLQLWILPYGVIKSALIARDQTKVSMQNGTTVMTYPMTGELSGVTVKATLDAKNLITKVETQSSDPKLVMEADYSDYADHGEIATDVQFPGHIVLKQDGKTMLDLQVKMADCNNPYLVFPVPSNVSSSQAAGD
jgi:hypothetical protein